MTANMKIYVCSPVVQNSTKNIKHISSGQPVAFLLIRTQRQ